MDTKSPNKQTEKNAHDRRRIGSVYIKIAGLTLGLTIVVYLAGYFLDRMFNTQRIITFGMLAISAPLIIWLNSIIIRQEIEKSSDKFQE